MEFDTRSLGYGGGEQPTQSVQGRVVRQTRQSQPAASPSNLEATVTSLSAQVRRLNARLARVEASIPTLVKNDKATADYVNRLGELVTTVNTQTQAAVKALRIFARGGGVQPQQYVPGRAADATLQYDTPKAGRQVVREEQPATGNGPDTDLVDPGTSSADDASLDYNDALFHGLIDDEEG